jgi:hypothetical protein
MNNDEPEKDPLYESIMRLVHSADIISLSSRKVLTKLYPDLSNINLDDWNFFVTVSALCYAFMGLSDSISSETRYNKLTQILSKEIQKWNQDAEYAMSDLMQFLNKCWGNAKHLNDEEATKLLASCLGAWCMVNFKLPVSKERPDPLALKLGMTIIISFKDWWKTKT